jgi:spoIIIJ-associated protein
MKKNQKQLLYEGKNVEDAINKALSELNVSREQIKIKVISEESKGLFGMDGLKPAKIKVFLDSDK